MDHNDAQALAHKLMRDHSLDGWSFKWDRALNRFGCCKHSTKTISLSWPLVGLNDEEQVKNTILHEIAHALVNPRDGHSVAWQAMAMAIGCDAMPCYDSKEVVTPKAAWIGECPCGKTIERQRRKRNLYHSKCGGDFVWRRNNG